MDIKPGLGVRPGLTESWVLWVNSEKLKKIKILIFYMKRLKKIHVDINYIYY